MKQPNISNQDAIIHKLNELYVMTRFKYLVQFENGSYATYDRSKSKNVIPLNDGLLKIHLKGYRTYGIFSGGYFSKFLTFDVDCGDNEALARWTTHKIIMLLSEDYGIRRNDIHVSMSGRKGYHVDLFFDKPVLLTDLQRFFAAVVADVGALPGGKIEFRPQWGAGVKLPLGIHQVTGNRCWFVDRDTLEPIEDFGYLLDVQPMDASIITKMDLGLTDEQVEEFERIIRTVDIDANILKEVDAEKHAKEILKAGRLLRSGTRHNTTVLLASFFNVHGWQPEDAIEAILNILHNTPREFFSKASNPEFWEKETKRLVGLAFERNYRLGNENKEIRIYKSEILEVLRCGTFRTKQMLYAMLVTSKRYGRTFTFPESVAMKMVGTSSKGTVWNTVQRLIDGGFIEAVKRGEIDAGLSKEKGHAYYMPNKYRLLIDEPAADEPYVIVNKDSDMVDVAWSLLTEKEIKNHVRRREFENRWKRKCA